MLHNNQIEWIAFNPLQVKSFLFNVCINSFRNDMSRNWLKLQRIFQSRNNSPSNKSGSIFLGHEILYHFLRFLLMHIVLPKDYGVIYLVSPILHCSSLLSNPCQKSSFIFKNLGLIIKTCTHYAQFFIKHYPIYIHIRVATL